MADEAAFDAAAQRVRDNKDNGIGAKLKER